MRMSCRLGQGEGREGFLPSEVKVIRRRGTKRVERDERGRRQLTLLFVSLASWAERVRFARPTSQQLGLLALVMGSHLVVLIRKQSES
ncbi:hypothetical protein IE53DRAFT_13681 [Violaceomyces palustris]|uniref:Uncharacterized protein n=1 Tax=Violaceomyces palustris TaxID=1673888 RepID=A0ACD0P257_9BASI|nr:hypothetical protein IE53DRAFT_13681 [Violaceomyces palustris]